MIGPPFRKSILFDYNNVHYLKTLLLNELLKMKFLKRLSKTSQEVTNTEMQDAYGEFVTHIVALQKIIPISLGCNLQTVNEKLNEMEEYREVLQEAEYSGGMRR